MQVLYVPFPTPGDQNFKADKPFNVSVAGSNIQSRVNVFLQKKLYLLKNLSFVEVSFNLVIRVRFSFINH